MDPPTFNVVNENGINNGNHADYLGWIENIVRNLIEYLEHSCSFWIFGYAYQLSYIIPAIENNFTYRQHIVLDKGLLVLLVEQAINLKMFPTVAEYIVYFHKEVGPFIKNYLQNKQAENKIKSGDINKKLGKVTLWGTWSTIAGKRQKYTISHRRRLEKT